MKVEYKVRPVTRYNVTRYTPDDAGNGRASGSCETKGEYLNPEIAYEVAYALCKAEHERLGYAPGDERIQYPEPIVPTGYTLKTE